MTATAPSGISGLRQGKTGGRKEPAYGPKTLVRPTRNRVGPSTGARGGGSPGMVRPSTIATRLRAIHDLTRDVEVVARREHPEDGDALLELLDGAAVYLDPPYVGAPRYAAVCPRPDVVALAERCRAAGARVVVSEAEPVIPTWLALDVSHEAARAGKREWLTCSHPPDPPAQLALFSGAAHA